MNIRNQLIKLTTLALVLFASVNFLSAQTIKLPEPRQEKLLNGLKLLIWNAPNDDKVTAKLRIHSGSAFDPKDKEGVMALLSDILFPDETAKEFFRDDLGGSLEIESNYDYIQINATAKTDKFLAMLETIANAVTNPQISKETTAKARSLRLEKVKELEKGPAYVADLAVAKRLFGDFPYGRARTGTSESLPKIDYNDLIFAKQRFLTADNATLAVIGNVKPDYVYRAARRYFGAWEKSDKKVPATFAQPEMPKTGLAVKDFPSDKVSELRVAFRDVARGDKDFYASKVLTKILQKRLQTRDPNNAVVSQNSRLLNGSVVLSFSNWNLGRIRRQDNQIALPMTDSIVKDLLDKPIGEEEFSASNPNFSPAAINDLADLWLDVDSFKLSSVKDEMRKAQDVKLADVNKLAEIWKNEPLAQVLVFGTSKSETANQ